MKTIGSQWKLVQIYKAYWTNSFTQVVIYDQPSRKLTPPGLFPSLQPVLPPNHSQPWSL